MRPTFEERFKVLYPNYRIEEEKVSANVTRFNLFVGEQPLSESADRELAFRWALEDIKEGKLQVHG